MITEDEEALDEGAFGNAMNVSRATGTAGVTGAMCRMMVFVCMAALALGGCDMIFGPEEEAPSEEETDTDSEDNAPPAAAREGEDDSEDESSLEEEEYERPEYPSSIRRNPFLPDMDVIRPRRKLEEDDTRPLEPLEEYGIGELRLVGIISEVAVPKAMFLDPDRLGHVVKEGDRIGENGGVIADIRDNEVEVREADQDEDGEETRMTTIELRSDELDETSEELSEEEREALERLLESEEGRRALEEMESDDGKERTERDRRFRNVAPPGER